MIFVLESMCFCLYSIIRERFLNEVAKTEEHKCIFAAFQKLSDEMAEIKTMIKDNSDTTTIHVTPRN